MKNLVELHLIQNFAPSNLNRDDTGSPKDAIFGGVRRARVSSQCFKRAIRSHFRDAKLIDTENLATRTKRVTQRLSKLLEEKGRPADQATALTIAALAGLEVKVADDEKSQYLLFLGEREIRRVADLIDEHWDELASIAQAETAVEKKSGREAKKAAKASVPSSLVTEMKKALDGGKAVDLALFGRMVADAANLSRDAAAQVAHAISVHKVEREFDFYTAVDDLKPEDNAGADMLGTIEFASACFYRYAVVDADLLVRNLQNDRDLAIKGIEAFLRASVAAIPTGKQNTFAAHNPPCFIAVSVRSGTLPRSLANAFEKPVYPRNDKSLSGIAVERLSEEWTKLDTAYGTGERSTIAFLNLTDGAFEYPDAESLANTLDDLIARAVSATSHLLKG